MNRLTVILFALLASGCSGKNACEELAECLDADAEYDGDPTDEEIEACEITLDMTDC